MAILWAQTCVSIVVVIFRFWARISIRAVGLDDWFMLLTLLLLIIFTSLVTVQALHGGDRHLYYIPANQQPFVSKMSWILQPFIIMAITMSKVSVSFLILRLVGPRPVWPKYTLYMLMVASVMFSTIDIILTFVQCSPVQSLWDASIPHRCWDPVIQTRFALFTGSWLVFMDVVLAVMPIFIFGRLKMNLKKRLGICGLLGGGIFAAVGGSIKTSLLGSLAARSDITWATYDLFIWNGVEVFLLIVCGSIPPLKILWDRGVQRKTRKAAKYSDIHPSSVQSFPLQSLPSDKFSSQVGAPCLPTDFDDTNRV